MYKGIGKRYRNSSIGEGATDSPGGGSRTIQQSHKNIVITGIPTNMGIKSNATHKIPT
jgi:hypothetical protein